MPNAWGETASEGFLYTAMGESFRREAAASATSLRAIMPGVHVTLVTDAPWESPAFDQVLVRSEPVRHGFEFKLHLDATPYAKTIFLDTDTEVVGPLDDCFRLLEHFDLLCHPDMFFYLPQDYAPDIGTRALAEFNTGVVAVRRSERTEAFFRIWRACFDELYRAEGFLRDQRSFLLAFTRSEVRVAPLGNEFNFMPYNATVLCGPVRVLHGRSKPEQRRVLQRRLASKEPRIFIPHLGWFPNLGHKATSQGRYVYQLSLAQRALGAFFTSVSSDCYRALVDWLGQLRVGLGAVRRIIFGEPAAECLTPGLALKAVRDWLLGRGGRGLVQRWQSHVAAQPSHQSKPEVLPIDAPEVCQHPFRLLGSRFARLRRMSGLALPPPSIALRNTFTSFTLSGSTICPKLPRPLLPSDDHHAFFGFHPAFTSQASFVLEVPKGVFQGHDHCLFDSELRLIDWNPPYWALSHGLPPTMFRSRLPKLRQVPGRGLVLSAPAAGNNFWHFLYDALPKLGVLEQAGRTDSFDFVAINRCQGKIQQEALQALGVDLNKVIETDDVPFIQAGESLTYISLGFLLPPDPWALHWLRERLWSAPCSHENAHRRIYLSRENTRFRRLIQEEQMWQGLQALGFEKVFLDRLSLAEQIEVMAEAEIIVAPHGAALTNLVWCRPETKVVEFFAPEYANVCYWNICEMLGLEYHYSVGEATLPSYQGNAAGDAVRGQAPINLTRVDAVLERISDLIAVHARS